VTWCASVKRLLYRPSLRLSRCLWPLEPSWVDRRRRWIGGTLGVISVVHRAYRQRRLLASQPTMDRQYFAELLKGGIADPRVDTAMCAFQSQVLRLASSIRNAYPHHSLWFPHTRIASGAHHGAVSAAAALLAYLPTHELGLKEGFWSAVTAISVVQTEFQATQTTARDQFLGAAVGGFVSVATSAAIGKQNLLVYAGAIVFSMLICWALNVASASRLAGSTATIILLVPHTGSAERMFAARLIEVGWGVCIAIAVVWIAARVPNRCWGGEWLIELEARSKWLAAVS
jgi:Fusaric acid resistance protein-like